MRIQLRTPPASIFGPLDHMRNELVVRFQVGVRRWVVGWWVEAVGWGCGWWCGGQWAATG